MISRKGNIKKDLAIMFNHGDIGELSAEDTKMMNGDSARYF